MRNFKLIHSLFFVILFLCACIAVKRRAPVNQGLAGYIYKISGNQMPGPGRTQSRGHGISCIIYIYTPTRLNETEGTSHMFSAIKTKLVAQTKSDSSGRYTVKLPPGKYSVFIAENGQYFAAESDAGGILNPVEIMPDKLTQKDFILNNNAVY